MEIKLFHENKMILLPFGVWHYISLFLLKLSFTISSYSNVWICCTSPAFPQVERRIGAYRQAMAQAHDFEARLHNDIFCVCWNCKLPFQETEASDGKSTGSVRLTHFKRFCFSKDRWSLYPALWFHSLVKGHLLKDMLLQLEPAVPIRHTPVFPWNVK